MGGHKMCRYPPSTIYRYLDLPYTHTMRTHNSHKHNTTPLFQTLFQSPYPLPTYTTHPRHPKHRHTSKPNPLTHTLSSHAVTSQTHTYPYYMHPPQPHLLYSPHHIADTLAPLYSLSIHTYNTKTVHASQSPKPPHLHRVQ